MWEVGHKVCTRDWHSSERHAYFKTTKQAAKKAEGRERKLAKKLLSDKHLSTWDHLYTPLQNCLV